ncbi:MAG: hypothetical protein JSU72_06020 [Deltaproteobacteria bacterium]|nr:MAG: hypothetical protein JSU72_06020 [Deltaproteobacteria bacterium]
MACADSDISSVAEKYKVNRVLVHYHSDLEHTFLWVVDAGDQPLIEPFWIETGIASLNYVKIVPLITFDEGVIPLIRKIHDL